MRIVVIGGSGLVGAKLVNNLRHRGHDVLAASPQSGVNTITGEGLAEAITGASVVVEFLDDLTPVFFVARAGNEHVFSPVNASASRQTVHQALDELVETEEIRTREFKHRVRDDFA